MSWVVYLFDLDNQTSHPVASFTVYEDALNYLDEDVIVNSRFDYYITREDVFEE